MSIKLQLPKVAALRPRITVVGVGGAGGNAVNNMILSGLEGVDFVVANTDAQALASSSAEHRIQLGVNLTEGLGAGSRPEIGEAAAEEALEDIRSTVENSHMLFIAAGMGGGTGTGAAAVIARIAKEAGVLTVGIVTKPFQFEGTRRARVAEAGVTELKKFVDTLIVIPNQNLFRIANEKTTFAEAFVLADQVLYSGIACIVDLIVKDGLINLDFADVRTVMKDMGTAVMGTGEGEGQRRAIMAAEEAISNPLLDDVSLKGAKGLLLSITGGRDMTLYEVDEAASRVRQEVDPEANIIVGATFDDTLVDRVRVSIVASGMARAGEEPQSRTIATGYEEPRRAPIEIAPTSPPVAAAAIASSKPASIPAEPVAAAHVSPPLIQEPRSAGAALRQQSVSGSSPQDIEADDLSRRLSAAFDYGVDGTAAASDDPPAAFEPNSSIAGEPWRAPGDVLVEEAQPRFATQPPFPAAPRTGQTTPPPLPQTPPTPATFEPAPPQEIRRATRRMPEVEDFPAVGQREYYAKAREDQDQPAGQPAPYAAPALAGQRSESYRKPGLLARLTGRSRPATDSPPSKAGGQVPVPHASHQGLHERVRGGLSAAEPRETRGGRGSREDVELPVFFSGERK